jgi:hypothetical protein
MNSKTSQSRILQSFVVLLFLQTIFMAKYCNGQFHWAKNPRLEVQKLRDLLQDMRNDGIEANKVMKIVIIHI